MDKKISKILQYQKSSKRIVARKFHDYDVEGNKISSSVDQLKHKVDGVKTPSSTSDDEESPPCTTTEFNTNSRSVAVPVSKARPTSSAQASTHSTLARAPAPPVSTPSAPGYSADAFVDALLSTCSLAAHTDY
ncbi:hypothetical protein D1007_28685 [Hordeum vulgare]|nr:hypothetical protein D1007_28685 [Hordeum vulgare]